MAIPHVQSGQVVDLLELGAPLLTEQTFALFKSSELEVMRVYLPAGKAFPPHKVAGEITVQCLQGRIEFGFDDQKQVLEAGQLLYLAGGVPHWLLGLEDATVLVTIVLRK
ncbi:cupin domain-containing protein [Hydrogenophaga sp.]|uniref:cupin domain-containing protein n=1 Tax=Hydrogenophaga sp. TaxID=1904254 RepID=UPI003568F104